MSMNWFRSNCRRSREQARLAAAGCLSEPERSQLAKHTGQCAECRYYAAELNVLSRLIQAWDATSPEPVVTPELSAQWQRAIEAEVRPGSRTVKATASSATTAPAWSGLDRLVPVSLVLIWLVTIGIHLNTPAIRTSAEDGFVPTLQEVRVVMEWLVKSREAA